MNHLTNWITIFLIEVIKQFTDLLMRLPNSNSRWFLTEQELKWQTPCGDTWAKRHTVRNNNEFLWNSWLLFKEEKRRIDCCWVLITDSKCYLMNRYYLFSLYYSICFKPNLNNLVNCINGFNNGTRNTVIPSLNH